MSTEFKGYYTRKNELDKKHGIDWGAEHKNRQNLLNEAINIINTTPLTNKQREEALTEAKRRYNSMRYKSTRVEAYEAELLEMEAVYHKELREYYSYVPEDLYHKLRYYAYEDQHHAGYDSVEECFRKLCDFMKELHTADIITIKNY